MKSFKEYLTEAGKKFERQETSFVNAIKAAVKKNGGNAVTVKTGDASIKNVINAKKYSDRASSGSEPYTDVQLFLKNGKFVNISMKGESAPSLAGGGLTGIEKIIPGFGFKFYIAAYKNHIKNKLKAGQKVPDTYGVLNDADKKLIVVGNLEMGGPIDYMYIGPMNVQSKFDNGVLTVNGKLTSAEKYAESAVSYTMRATATGQTVTADEWVEAALDCEKYQRTKDEYAEARKLYALAKKWGEV